MGSALSVAATVTILRSTINELIPSELRGYTTSLVRRYSSEHTLVINESHEDSNNDLFDAVKVYLGGDPLFSTVSVGPQRFVVGKSENFKKLTYCLDSNSEVVDDFNGVPMKWKYSMSHDKESQTDEFWYELHFHKKHLKMVCNHYLPHILETAKSIKDQNKIVKLYTIQHERWTSNPMSLSHPMTFDTLALDKDVKDSLLRDLTEFMNGKDYYRKIGKVWKRGYLLYGPPGTGKSSLIAAMANFLNYDIYNMNLSNVCSDSGLEYLLLRMSNRSILVIEDIDCSIKIQNRESVGKGLAGHGGPSPKPVGCRRTTRVALATRAGRHVPAGADESASATFKLTLSGLLNAIDGLLSCCGDERVIVFTTNYKDKIDPALLRPGRMDVHVHLSYCTFSAFEQLCQNYLGISNDKVLFGRIEEIIGQAKATPAEVAGELMKTRDPTASLEGLIEFLEKKVEVVRGHYTREEEDEESVP